ncbi:MAG: vWA domain-containing protein [Nitrososphaera sp.]
MILQGSFYSQLYEAFTSLQIDDYFQSSHLTYPGEQASPSLWIDAKTCAVSIPIYYSSKGAVAYCKLAFSPDGFGYTSLGRLALASTTLLAAKGIELATRKPAAINKWIHSKDDVVRASYVVNSILDRLARQRIQQSLGEQFYTDVIRSADLLSLCCIPKYPGDLNGLFKRVLTESSMLLSQDWTQRYPGPAVSFASEYSGLIEGYQASQGEKDKSSGDSSGSISSLAESLYSLLKKIPPAFSDGTYLAYSNLLDSGKNKTTRNARAPSIISESDFAKACVDFGLEIKPVDDTYAEMVRQLARDQKKIAALRETIAQTSQGLNFDYYDIARMDYGSYKQLSKEIALEIRMISERISTIKYVSEEKHFLDSGNVDLQVAIQAIASQSARDDMFFREEDTNKSEAWTILLDASKSLQGSSRTVRTIAICLAETANQIIGQRNWAMFAFSDRISGIKYYGEPFDFTVKSRIGGLKQSGLTHIPDALRLTRNLAGGASQTERNYTIMVTDGIASGYSNIEDEFSKSVSEVKGRGIKLAAIGVGSGGESVAKNVKLTRTIDQPAEVVKAFVDIYFDLSASA